MHRAFGSFHMLYFTLHLCSSSSSGYFKVATSATHPTISEISHAILFQSILLQYPTDLEPQSHWAISTWSKLRFKFRAVFRYYVVQCQDGFSTFLNIKKNRITGKELLYAALPYFAKRFSRLELMTSSSYSSNFTIALRLSLF